MKNKELTELCKAAKQYSDEYVEYSNLKKSIERMEKASVELEEMIDKKHGELLELQYPQKAFDRLREAALKYGEERSGSENYKSDN
jgi:hypothetical protein